MQFSTISWDRDIQLFWLNPNPHNVWIDLKPTGGGWIGPPLKNHDDLALLQPNLVFQSSLGFWVDSNGSRLQKMIRLLQNAAKSLFAANGIIWKLMHWLIPNLVHGDSLWSGVDSDGSHFQKNSQVAAKCCKITWFAANGMIWKLMHWLVANLVHRDSLSWEVDSDGSLFHKNYQFAAKCCKITWFAANSIIWKLIHWLVPNLVHRDSLSCGGEPNRFHFRKNIWLLQIAAKKHDLQQIVQFRNSILQHPGYFFEETSLNQFRIPNYPSILSKELFDETFLKSYHLLQKILFCSILQWHNLF